MSSKDALREAIIGAGRDAETIGRHRAATGDCDHPMSAAVQPLAPDRSGCTGVQGLGEEALLIPAPFSRAIDIRSGSGAGRLPPVWRPVASTDDATAEEGLELYRDSAKVVMIVDDEPLLVELTAEMVIELGYVPLTFGSSERACAAFDDADLKVDLLLTDEKMPSLSGSELVAAIRARGWDIPVLMMSGDVTAALRQRARAVCVCALLHKPLSRKTLAAAIARCLRLGRS